jgi:Type I restriction modification DNA specificity domain
MSCEWIETRLGDACQSIKRGNAPKYVDEGRLVFNQKCVREENRIDSSPARRTDASRALPEQGYLRVGDVLINSTGRGTLGRAAELRELPEPATADSHVTIVRPDPKRFALGFAGLALSTRRADFESLQTGSTNQTELSAGSIAALSMDLPPIPAQKRIVEIVSAVDDQITALDVEARALAAFLRRRRAELINDQGAPVVRADEAFEITMGRQRAPQYAMGPYMTPYLRSANVGYGTLDLTDVLEMNFDPKEREVFGLVPGDVLVSEGSASQSAVGMPVMWRGELPEPICFQKTLIRYRAIEGVSVPAFVNHWCLWAYESGTFLDIAGGTNIRHITAMRAVRMPVRLPDVADQERIAAELDTVSEVVAATRAEAHRLRSVRAGLVAGLLDRTIDIESAAPEV